MSNVTSAEVVAAKISRGAFDRAMKSMPSFPRPRTRSTCRHAGEFHLSDISAALVGCGHVSGLFVRHGRPLALMLSTSGPDPSRAFRDAAIQTGTPDPGNDRICTTSTCPHQYGRWLSR